MTCDRRLSRRQALGATVGTLGLLSGCLQSLPFQSGGLTIKYKGDSNGQTRNTVIVMVSEADSQTFYNATGQHAAKLSDDTGLFFEKYVLTKGDTVHPDVYVPQAGTYRLNVYGSKRSGR